MNRVVCYCDDCQTFLHYLRRADLLDAQGGSDIVQIAPASLSFVQGKERIVGLRLTPKGLYRWYASCCGTPLGNTLSPAIPFVGIIAQAFQGETQGPDDLVGRPIGAIYGKYAVGGPPEGSTGFQSAHIRASYPHGPWMAPVRANLAAFLLCACAARSPLSAANVVSRGAGGTAFIVRSALVATFNAVTARSCGFGSQGKRSLSRAAVGS